jgi:predicted acylesterase/phospholipase RssA
MKQIVFALILALTTITNTACTTVMPRNPAPLTGDAPAEIPGIENARFWGDDVPSFYDQRLKTLSKSDARRTHPALYGRPHHYLALSGGGQNGAFGAGLLVGWTASGSRPEFQIVTGISTGALAAPFAFLGPSYDHKLKEVYTTIKTEDIMKPRNWLSVLFSDAVADSEPLLIMIACQITDDVVDAIAAEHRKGRRLYIGTTDLDRMRPQVWDIGTIANSGHPGAKELIHKVLLASASIPGAFPPVRINVESDGKIYDELHADGGTTSQVFVYPSEIDWRKILKMFNVPDPVRIYVIRNASLKPEAEHVDPWIVPISGRSISSLIRTQGIGDLYHIYVTARRDKADYNLAYIPDDFHEKSSEPFDTEYMNHLFNLGYNLAREGYPWHKTPPNWVE